ncbi:MAG: hypothetical protein GX590_09915 [Lentisphaerae bacterium]|nr:hypothetical protein [Lentisphaerota bacterium]
MKASSARVLIRTLVAAVLPLLAARAPAAESPETREWSSRSGATVTAALVGVQQNMVSLQTTNGAVLRIRLGDLTPPGQAAVAAWVERQQRGPAYQTEGVASNRVPVFTEGPGRRYHSVYTHPNFIARVNRASQVEIEIRDGTNTFGRPLILRPLHHYVSRQEYGRAIVGFDEIPRPTLDPKELTFTGRMADGVTFSWSYAFVDNTVQCWGWVRDPPGIKYPTRFQMRLYVPAVRTFENSVPMDERKRLLAPFELRVEPPKGKTVVYPFWQGQQSLIGLAEQVTVDGPVYGSRRLSVTASQLKDGRLIPVIYRGTAPYEGFSVALIKNEIDKRSDRFRMIVTID